MPPTGWKQLLPPPSYFRGADRHPIDAYSEFMPPPRLGWKPYGDEAPNPQLLDPEDPWGWYVTEYEEANELRRGLEQIAGQVVVKLRHMLRGEVSHGLSRRILQDNLYWPPELDGRAGALAHERCVTLLPLALARTQDDKGRVPWTLFGVSEQGPARAFWKSFFMAPDSPRPEEEGTQFVCRLLRAVYGESAETGGDLQKAGFRILPGDQAPLDFWEEPLPGWATPFLLSEGAPPTGVKYLLTFRPFGKLPDPVRQAYLSGVLHLLPCPASLVFWGVPRFLRLHTELPLGLQAPLLYAMTRHRAPGGVRVPQAGVLHEPNAQVPRPTHPELVRNTFKRTHRWDRVLRDQDELALLQREDKLLHVLFSSLPDDLGLYDKPMARNVQLWTPAGAVLLDGPPALPEQLREAMRTVQAGGEFGYRLQFPAMRVGTHEVYWHRPLVAYHHPDAKHPDVLPEAPLGYLTAYATEEPKGASDARLAARAAFRVPASALEHPVELWPRLHRRPLVLETLPLFHQEGRGPTTARNVRKLLDAFHLRGDRPLPRGLARQLVTLPKEETLDHWLGSLPEGEMSTSVRALIEPEPAPLPRRKGAKVPESLTFARTAKRTFELAYWKTIATLAEGQFLNKNNADCVGDTVTQSLLPYPGRHLDALGDYLLGYHAKRIDAAGMAGRGLVGAFPIRWSTDFDFSWMGGWLKNQEHPAERDVIVVIPGQDRSRAVIMADHYDTAYMADRYEKEYGGRGARLAACGADDNYSATAALMLAAPVFLDMSKRGRLGCDVWLVHLTGEEFPADCLGARHLTEALVEGTLVVKSSNGGRHDLTDVRVQGVYVADMIAHNNDRERDVFQISPGTGRASWWLAEQAQHANTAWNESVPVWNQRADRKDQPRGRRSPYGAAVPETAAHLALHGQVRPVTDPRSTLYNTDGQIFSDAGVPVVLFMENYDINRSGYHDTHDTMANIDLDYGAALTAIFIESVARAACDSPDA
jgi:hypothetical protein